MPAHYLAAPGYTDYRSLRALLSSNMFEFTDLARDLKPLSGRDMIEREFVVTGSPATVREKLEASIRRLNVGHLITVLQFGSMPHQMAMDNIDLFGREVLPHLQNIWSETEYPNHWWPNAANKRKEAARSQALA
jgi:alkanesulfonate monooxygenase SsuD/methylene tetrahydromethanopterin reductase-like flavin-dependent oxidoreductase (luciferase family)